MAAIHTLMSAAPSHGTSTNPQVRRQIGMPATRSSGAVRATSWPSTGAGRSRGRRVGDELAKVVPGDAGEASMRQGRTDPCWRSHPGMIVRPCSRLHDPHLHDPLDQPEPSRTTSYPCGCMLPYRGPLDREVV